MSISQEKHQSGSVNKISLAEWSLHRGLEKGEMDHLDFPSVAANEFGIQAVEYMSVFFQDKARDYIYLEQLKDSCS